MEKFENQNAKKKKILIAVLAAVVVLIAIILMAAGGGNDTPNQSHSSVETTGASRPPETPETSAPVAEDLLILESTENQGEWVVLTTSCGVMKYPFSFSDLIQVEAVSDENQGIMKFSVKIGESVYPVYSVSFGSGEGFFLGSMEIGDTQVRVYGAMDQLPEGLEESGAATFFAAQESFNDIVSSLKENERFVPAE